MAIQITISANSVVDLQKVLRELARLTMDRDVNLVNLSEKEMEIESLRGIGTPCARTRAW